MKTSVSLSVFKAKPGMPVLYSGATEEHLKQIKELGYDGVDLFVYDPEGTETKEAIRRLEKYHLGVGVIMPAALAGEGFVLGSEDKEIKKKAIQRIGEIIKLAGEAGGMVSLGLVRGNRNPNETMAAFESRFTESCEMLLEIAQPRGVDLLIEPINRYEINTINSAREGIDYVKRANLPLYLMLDTFHMNIEDTDIAGILIEGLPFTKHIHFLDSNRLAPSMGHMDMEHYYRVLEKAGYDGYLCLEALPVPSSDVCAAKGAEFFQKMKNRKGMYR